MEHNLDDSLTLESAMGSMDFDHSDVVVNQEDITLEDSNQNDNIPMDLEQIEEQPLMDTGGEEVIISDFIGDEFSFQEYTVQGNSNEGTVRLDQNQLNVLLSQNETFNLQLTDNVASIPTISANTSVATKPITIQPKQTVKKTIAYPREIAIAPKPANVPASTKYAIAPKPVALVMNKNAGNKLQAGVNSNSVLAQVGKQLVMVPANANAGQKIKLMPAASGDSGVQFAQIVSNKGSKPVMFVQGQSKQESNPGVVTKLMPMTSQARYVMQQKTVPLSVAGNRAKVIITTPSKQNLKLGVKKQFFTIKSQNQKAATTQDNVTTKRVVITSNPSQSLVMKAAPKNVTQASKDNTSGLRQHTQLHPINVPGKGIQYIKLVTNQPAAPKPKPKPSNPAVAVPAKNFVLTDGKGNVIQMAADKLSTQPPPLVLTGMVNPGGTKTQKKLVRIAPMSSKSGSQTSMISVRSSQSLLAPITTTAPTPVTNITESTVSIEEFNEMVEQSNMNQEFEYMEHTDNVPETDGSEETVTDKPSTTEKPTLQSLISDAVGDSNSSHNMDDVRQLFKSKPNVEKITIMLDETNSNIEANTTNTRQEESPIIIVPSTYGNQSKEQNESMYSDETRNKDDGKNVSVMSVNVEAEVIPYSSSDSPTRFNESDVVTSELGLRPRKACNCTKSQCLKLYCDCFANGEFCNNCNCNNCYNNLENEELRQKAIRQCLERNPNAFRPKIGKAKASGPEVVRRHNKGCNCKRSGCLKNYCECYEAKIACTNMCKCVGCRNVEETLERRRGAVRLQEKLNDSMFRPPLVGQLKQPCSFMTMEVIEAVCQCVVAAAGERGADPVADVIEEFARCLTDIIAAAHQGL